MSDDFDFDALERDVQESTLTLGMSDIQIVKTFYTILHVASVVGESQNVWKHMASHVTALGQYQVVGDIPRTREDPAWDTMVDVIAECIPFGSDWMVEWMKLHRVAYLASWMPVFGEWEFVTFGNIARIKADFDLTDEDIGGA